MHADVVTKITDTSVADLRSQALKERCALTVETLMVDIVCADVDENERSQAILDIAIARNDLPHIQARSCRDLCMMDPGRARELIRFLLKQSPNDERDIVRARAFATLVELPNLTEQEVLAVAYGLKDRFPIVREHVARAIKALPSDRFRELQAVVEKLADEKGAHVVALKQFVSRVVPEVGGSTEQDFKLKVSKDSFSARDSQLYSSSKTPRARIAPAKPLRIPPVQRVPPAKACGTDQLHSSTEPAVTARKQVVDTPMLPSAPPTNAVNLSALFVPPRREVSSDAASLQVLRSEEFVGMTWVELRLKIESAQTPRSLCACIAEMAARFGKDATLQVAAGQLCFVASHTDPEIKAMAGTLSAYLFSF